ncbi:MAG TPA: STAS domain-containing protein [Pseudonocardiaceae bacterium]
MTSDIIHTYIRTGAAGERIIAVTGEVDLATAAALQRDLDSAARHRTRLTVDLAACDFLDSAGIKVLFDIAARLDLELIVDPESVIATMIEISGLGQVSSISTPSSGPASS